MRGALLGLLAVLFIAACGAATAPGDGSGTVSPPPASGELIGQGTVLSVGEEPPVFCLGPVMESFPPQCSGPKIIGWDWSGVDQSTSASDVMWGTYAVQGTWDGTAFTVTQPPVPLALYDPPATFDPRLDKENPGSGTEEELLALQEQLHQDAGTEILTSWIENGYLFVTVVYDDGTLQDIYDADFGPGLIAVQSALRPVS